MKSWLRNPWGRPRFLPIVTGLYILWSIMPVTVAVLFAFNDGRSRTTWQGFSTRWFSGDPGSVRDDPALVSALQHTLLLAVLCVLVAVPLGVALALGLQRWRGFGSGSVNTLMLLPLVTPELVMGVALLLLFLQIFNGWGLGTTAQAIGQVTFAVSYVVVIVRGRLVSIGREYEEAAADLGAPPVSRLTRVFLPMLAAGDPGERRSRLRPLDRRLRDHAVLVGRREHEHGVDAALLDGPGGAVARAERARLDHARDHARDDRARVPCVQTLRGGGLRLRGGDVRGGCS